MTSRSRINLFVITLLAALIVGAGMSILWRGAKSQKASPDPDLRQILCNSPETWVSAGIGELTILVTAYNVINDGDNGWKYFVIKLVTVANPHGDITYP